MSYNDFTLQTVVKELQLVLNERTNLFAQIPESTITMQQRFWGFSCRWQREPTPPCRPESTATRLRIDTPNRQALAHQS